MRTIHILLLILSLTFGVLTYAYAEEVLDIDSLFLDNSQETTTPPVNNTEAAAPPTETPDVEPENLDDLLATEEPTTPETSEATEALPASIEEGTLTEETPPAAVETLPTAIGEAPIAPSAEAPIAPITTDEKENADSLLDDLLSASEESGNTLPSAPPVDTLPSDPSPAQEDVVNDTDLLDDIVNDDSISVPTTEGMMNSMPLSQDSSEESGPAIVDDGSWTGSLMFSGDDIKSIEAAITLSQQPLLTEDDMLADDGTGGEQTRTVAQIAPPPPNYFLNSILYISDSHWSVWLNGKKLSENDPSERVQIAQVQPGSIKLVWKAGAIDEQIPGWRDLLKNTEGTSYTSNDKRITYDITTKELSFILRPNQRFIGKDLAILEGPEVSATTQTPVGNTMNNGLQAQPGQNNPTSQIPPELAQQLQNAIDTSGNSPQSLEAIANGGIQNMQTLQNLGNVVNSIEAQ